MKLVFATNNLHKLREIQSALPAKFEIISLKELGFSEDIPEPYETLEENASGKAWYIYNRFGINCFADDTGLEIKALNNAPGVYSARYAGPECSFKDNMNKVMLEMQGIQERTARFRTIISLILEGKEYQFEGQVDGRILTNEQGREGFGYDPIFAANDSLKSFAELSLEEKNQISHRGKAVEKLVAFLSDQVF